MDFAWGCRTGCEISLLMEILVPETDNQPFLPNWFKMVQQPPLEYLKLSQFFHTLRINFKWSYPT
jgi:hypothetical protein